VLGDLAALQHVSFIDPRVGVGCLIVLLRIKEGGADRIRRRHDVPATAEIGEADNGICIDDDGWLLPIADVECQTTIRRWDNTTVSAVNHTADNVRRTLIEAV